MPVVLYFRLMNNPKHPAFDVTKCKKDGQCSTFNFKYPPHIVDGLTGLTEFTMMEHKEDITEILQAVSGVHHGGKAEKAK